MDTKTATSDASATGSTDQPISGTLDTKSDYKSAQKEAEDAVPDDLKCSVCHDVFCVPVTAQCQHTFCQECVEGIQTLPNCGGASVPLVPCPLCRREFALPPLASKNLIIDKLVKTHLGDSKHSARQNEWLARKHAKFVEREDNNRTLGAGHRHQQPAAAPGAAWAHRVNTGPFPRPAHTGVPIYHNNNNYSLVGASSIEDAAVVPSLPPPSVLQRARQNHLPIAVWLAVLFIIVIACKLLTI